MPGRNRDGFAFYTLDFKVQREGKNENGSPSFAFAVLFHLTRRIASVPELLSVAF